MRFFKIISVLLFALISVMVSFGQGIVRGKITDENGDAAINAMIALESKSSVRAATDLNGNYSIKIPDSTVQTLLISYLGHDTEKVSVNPLKGQVLIKNIGLKLSGSSIIKEITIVSKAVKARDNYMEKMKMQSSVTLNYVSAETMKKTGDANVTSAVTRVSGVSTNRGGMITVRGIGDRYIETTINGSRIPTLDPFTNNIKLDLFPASLVDNVIITKTANPDLPGDWAGAYLSVETKDYPEKLSVNVESSFGYNNNTTFKDVISSQRSSTDWLGYDNGFRDIDHKLYVPANSEPTSYQEMVALGLGDYYKSLGVSANSWSSTFFNLGLVQLGLLQNSQLGDPSAIAAATDQYNRTYKTQAFDALNAKAVQFGKSLPNNWTTTTRKAPLSFSQSFSIGNQIQLFKRALGFVAGFRYGSSIQSDPASTANRIRILSQLDTLSSSWQQSSIETNGWSALMNLAYRLNSNHSISLLFMPNFTGMNNVKKGISSNIDEYGDTLIYHSQFYEERRQLAYQFKSEHYFPRPKLKIGLNASYTFGKSSVPDFKILSYLHSQQGGYTIGGGNPLERFYRYLSENLFDSHISCEFPLDDRAGLVRKLKFGGAYQNLQKQSDQYDYAIHLTGTSKNFDGDVEQYLDPSNFEIISGTLNGVPTHSLGLNYLSSGRPWDHNIGHSSIASGFAMVDYAIRPYLRFSGGLRVEKSNLYTDALKYDTLNYAADDPRRNFLYPGTSNELNYLPSANIIYKLKQDEEAPINLRLNFSQTVARPSLRELSGYYTYDYELANYVIGNPRLKTVQVNNFDLRLESVFHSGDDVSLSVFYKGFKNHIELVNAGSYSWQNVDSSFVKGVEIEGKKTILKHIELRANVTVVDSRSRYNQYAIQIDDVGNLTKGSFLYRVDRTMYGQAPYIVNTIFSYKADSIGLTAALSYNLQGPKLVIPGALDVPDVFEHPRNMFDAKLTKTLGKYFSFSLTVRDILNTSVKRTYRRDNKWLLDYDEYRYGTTYILSVSYKL